MKTIVKAIITVLKGVEKPLTTEEVYRSIVDRKLYAFGAKDPKSVVNGKLRRHSENLEFPSASLAKHFYCIANGPKRKSQFVLLRDKARFVDSAIEAAGKSAETAQAKERDATPPEMLQKHHLQHLEQIGIEILDELKKADSKYFVKVTMDLLTKMGYGGFPDGMKLTDGPGDRGIDGYIFLDPFGIEKVKIQAKRYAERVVEDSEVRNFAGSKNDIEKGVFITTSRFSKATRSSKDYEGKKIKLIDGEELVKLLIKYEVGVTQETLLPIYAVSQEYFRGTLDEEA